MILVGGISVLAGQIVASKHGTWAGIGLGISSGAAVVGVFILLRWANQHYYVQPRRRQLRDRYRYIYKVIALPGNLIDVRKPIGAELVVGDYGWEAPPLKKDGLL